MYCPVCKDTKLVISNRQEVEIDYCPDCRGVWLDRGELDKIIERSTKSFTPARDDDRREPYREKDDDRRDLNRDSFREKDGYYRENEYKKKKRGGFLEDIFDF
jgi:Zn-finger nucleic acid-binding protein